ncbi:MAG TPA: hypothetical protein VFK11_03670 [Candidatus Saccharimonadales bacterium]|nr:hypothetical protein [Candidatus Saccharimonadales bacterium]
MPENSPEFNISLANVGNLTHVVIKRALGTEQIQDIRSCLEEIADRKLVPWVKPPLRVIQEDEGKETEATKLVFKNTNHFGRFRNIYGENAGRIIGDILELDGFDVALEEKVETCRE